MNIKKTNIEGLLVIEPNVFEDQRGYFFESYNKNKFNEAGLVFNWVQDNQSKSVRGVLRGLHYQLAPRAQSKLIRVLEGTIFDVAVDIRKGSPTFGKWHGLELSAENLKQFLVPKGFAHGFSVLSETATVFYKCDEFYAPEYDRGIYFNDPALGIDWQLNENEIILSEKDRKLPVLKEAEINFLKGKSL
ncbi:MAG: dTDP-4-dehydrorhamnose 3,5-epimerase [Bacteroidota bacterium]